MAKIAGFILRAPDRHATAAFYQDLGLDTREHQHGGPKHHEVLPLSEDCVLEIYPSSAQFSQDALMVEVDSIQLALEVARKYNLLPLGEIKETPGMKFVYITDPDKRPLMLIEKT